MGKNAFTRMLSVLALGALQACVHSTKKPLMSLDAIQGGWWSSCNDPAVEFLIRGDKYSGDFAGTYTLTLTRDVLVFSEGLIDGHSINVAHEPLSFRILSVSDKELVLRPLPGNPYVGDWKLYSCS